MALTWDLGEIADYESVCFIVATEPIPDSGIDVGDKYLNPLTNALIWSTITVAIGKISEDNADEFYARLHFTELVVGPFLRKSGEPYYITPEDVRAHIGLQTNATSFKGETRAKFLGRFKYDLDSFKGQYKRELEKAAATS